MKNKVMLTFPCTQNWNDIPSIGKDKKYCATCNKCITNFSNLSRKEVKRRISQMNTDVCGMFTIDQLDNIQHNYTLTNFKNLTISVLSLLGIFATAQNITAQTGTINLEEKLIPDTAIAGNPLNIPITISGKLRDKLTLQVATRIKVEIIQQERVIKSVYTNHKGEFSFELLKDELTDSLITIRVMYNPLMDENEEYTALNDGHLASAKFDLLLSGIPTFYLLKDYSTIELLQPNMRNYLVLGRTVSSMPILK